MRDFERREITSARRETALCGAAVSHSQRRSDGPIKGYCMHKRRDLHLIFVYKKAWSDVDDV